MTAAVAPFPPAAGPLEALRDRVLGHPVLRHPLVRAFREGSLSWPEVRRFGLLYYPHIQRTRLYQARALSVMPDEPLQAAFASILADEYGHGDLGATHPAIYRRFLRALGFGPADWDRAPVLPALGRYTERHFSLCGGASSDPANVAGWAVAAGAAGLAMEWPIPALYGSLVLGLRRFPPLDEGALELFTGHMGQDDEHAGLVETALEPWLAGAGVLAGLEEGALGSMDARLDLMDALLDAVRDAGRST